MTDPKCDVKTNDKCNTMTSVHETTINNKKFVLCLNPREINECSFYGIRNGVLGYWKER